MPFGDLRAEVLEPSLCASCGACELACPREIVHFQGLEPRLRPGATDADCGACTDCLDVCPGRDPATPEVERELFGRERTTEERWLGIMRTVYGGRATSPEVFERSASGGSTTTLLEVAMEHLELEGMLVMGRSRERPWRSAPEICRDVDELRNYAQSTYQIAPYLRALRPLLLAGRRVGVVGLACHVQGLRKLQRLDSEIGRLARDNVAFVAEIGCSSGTTPTGTETIITDILGLELESVASVRYREGDYPGQIRVETRDGANHDVPFWKAVRHFATNKTHRCLACGDWVSGLADVTLSDGDPNIFDASLGLSEIHKHGRIFVRTETGARILDQAVATGALEVWPIELVGLNLGLERKRNRRAEYERRDVEVPEGPIPGYQEDIEIIPDDELLAVRDDPDKVPAVDGAGKESE